MRPFHSAAQTWHRRHRSQHKNKALTVAAWTPESARPPCPRLLGCPLGQLQPPCLSRHWRSPGTLLLRGRTGHFSSRTALGPTRPPLPNARARMPPWPLAAMEICLQPSPASVCCFAPHLIPSPTQDVSSSKALCHLLNYHVDCLPVPSIVECKCQEASF